MTTLNEKVMDEGRTKDAEEKETFDTLRQEIKALDVELTDLRDLQKLNAEKAVPAKGENEKEGTETRGGFITMKSNAPKGAAFTRYVMALARS